MSSSVWRRRVTAGRPSCTITSGGSGAAVVVGAHHRAVRAAVANHHQVADVDGRQHRSRANVSVLSQIGPTISDGSAASVARLDRLDAMERAVERGAHQLGHAGVEHDEALGARQVLHVDHPREQHARRPDQTRPGSRNREPGVADDGRPRRGVLLAVGASPPS